MILPGSYVTLVVEATHISERLDLFLSQKFPAHSRTFFKELISQGHITINDKPTKGSVIVKPGDKIAIFVPEIALPTVTAALVAHLGVEVIFQHEDFLIINKPAGLVVH